MRGITYNISFLVKTNISSNNNLNNYFVIKKNLEKNDGFDIFFNFLGCFSMLF